MQKNAPIPQSQAAIPSPWSSLFGYGTALVLLILAIPLGLKEHLAQVFDPFFTTKPHGKGTGLGLSICHGIVERLGSAISVASEAGKGSSFTVKLPQALRPQEI
ncbi:MAG: ATP-binding protein [Thermodesulfobacteriota bacterium]